MSETTTHAHDPYPEHTKLGNVQEAFEAIENFIEQGGYILATYPEDDTRNEPRPLPTLKSARVITAEFLEIDLAALESEKRAMLADLG